MNSLSSHRLRRHYAGEKEGRTVADWLNTTGREQVRISRLLDRLLGLVRPSAFVAKKNKTDAQASEGFSVTSEPMLGDRTVTGTLYMPGVKTVEMQLMGKKGLGFLSDPDEDARYAKALMEINQQVGRIYGATPQFSSQVGDHWLIGWKYKNHASWALQRVVWLAENGFLHRLRKCNNCSKWFYARFNHSRFCSLSCQQKAYRATPEWKEHRRRYMRNYYHRGGK